jgi:hypothetical protein
MAFLVQTLKRPFAPSRVDMVWPLMVWLAWLHGMLCAVNLSRVSSKVAGPRERGQEPPRDNGRIYIFGGPDQISVAVTMTRISKGAAIKPLIMATKTRRLIGFALRRLSAMPPMVPIATRT